METEESKNAAKLVNAERLLEALFDEESKPSLRWLRQMQAQGVIPYYKLGHLVRFNISEVRDALEAERRVNTRTSTRRLR
jgi:hypothetical protein